MVHFLDDRQRSVEEIDILNTIFLEESDAKAYIKAHPPEERKKMHVQCWEAQ